MSSPSRNTRGSRRISMRSPSEIACKYVSCAISVMQRDQIVGRGVDAVVDRGRVGLRRVLRTTEGLVQQLLHAARDPILLLVGQLRVVAQPGAVALDRVARGPLLEELLRHVEGVVVDGVAL